MKAVLGPRAVLVRLAIRQHYPYLLLLFILSILFYLKSPLIVRTKVVYSSFPYDPSRTLAYRNHLELTTSPETQLRHSPTLTFDKIYVLSLPTRLDRREEMSRIAGALGLEIEFVDASLKTEPWFLWIAERVAETRKKRVKLMAKARRVAASTIGGISIGSPWLSQTLDEKGHTPFPPHTSNWVAELELAHSSGNLSLLQPSSPSIDATELLWDPVETLSSRQVTTGMMSTYWGHTRVLKKIVESGDRSALVMEDDVDVEWDIERLWSRIARKMPSDWDMAYLGHCWSHELIKPQYLHPLLHETTQPMCLHGWAVSSLGARRLLSLLNNPWNAYTTAVDLAVPSFIRFDLLKSFSVEPPLIIQRKDGPSDLVEGNGSKWRGFLRDSTWDRIRRDMGEVVEEEQWDKKVKWWNRDPASVFREKLKCGAKDGEFGGGDVTNLLAPGDH
ncbi:hypothetical protein MNV49_007494 [Pseudohyphozyma bogoriensis]|nr:hypothetical protein MNV49_007494 [Pseudohyphozyma bogoriensis]